MTAHAIHQLPQWGVGLRPQHYQDWLSIPMDSIDWLEVMVDDLIAGDAAAHYAIERIAEQFSLVFHGVSLSVAGTDPLDRHYLDRLKQLIEQFSPAWISDHICWTGVGGQQSLQLLPVPYTSSVVDHIVSRIQQVQDSLQRPMIFENISRYIDFKQSTMTEAEFYAEICRRAGCKLLLDINNIVVNAYNHSFDAYTYINQLPKDSVRQYHLAGYQHQGHYLLDSHDAPVSHDVWQLYRTAVERFGAWPTLLEWDSGLPSTEELVRHLQPAREIVTRAQRQEATHV